MKLLRYVVLIAGIIIWATALSPFLISKVGEMHWIKDGYHYGDLYRLSNLSAFRDPKSKCPPYKPKRITSASGKKIHLYIIGDSFTEKERVGAADFPVDAYTYVHWSNFLHFKADTSETNILLLESVERHFRQKREVSYSVLVPDSATFIAPSAAPRLVQRLDDAVKSRHTEDRIDALLFQNDFILTLKEWKADFNHKVFDRVNSTVTLVNDDRDMVYYMDTDTPKVTSSFTPVGQSEIDSMVTMINRAADHAKSIGFAHTILAVVPNKVTVVAPDYGKYNNVIERVYQHPDLQLPVVDVLPEFRKMGRAAYLKGDSHWTCEAQYLWLGKVAGVIENLTARKN